MAVAPLLDSPSISGVTSPGKQKEVAAARDFEAILIAQMLRSVRESDSGWLGTGDDDAGATAMGLGEEELAKAMAAAGGFGLSKIIESGLAAQSQANSAAKIPKP